MDETEDKLGGPGTIVEIDEAKFGRRKYHRGRLVDGHWVLGGVERGTDNVFLSVVPSRDAATLLPIVQHHVLPGTTIHTDQWRAYNDLQRIGYGHGTVNHRYHFVDPATGVHTQSIEGTWTHVKEKLKRHGTSDDLFPSYLMEYIWRRKYGRQAFANLVNHITVLYPVNNI